MEALLWGINSTENMHSFKHYNNLIVIVHEQFCLQQISLLDLEIKSFYNFLLLARYTTMHVFIVFVWNATRFVGGKYGEELWL